MSSSEALREHFHEETADPVDHEASQHLEEVTENVKPAHEAPKEPVIEHNPGNIIELEEVRARLRNQAEEAEKEAPATEHAPNTGEGHEKHESVEGKIEKPHTSQDKPKTKNGQKAHGKEHAKEHAKEHGKGGHGDHHGPSKLDVLKGSVLVMAGAGLLAAGALGESTAIVNLLGLTPLVHGSLAAIGLGSVVGGAGFVIGGLASLGALNFFANLAISLFEGLKTNPPWKGVLKIGSGSGGGGGGHSSGGGHSGGGHGGH